MSDTKEIVRTDFEEYAPTFDEVTGGYIDVCPYEKYSRGQNKVYTCPCISGRTLNNRQQFLQHFKTKAHTNRLKNMGNDGSIKLIKELRVLNGKNENKVRLQARHLKRLSVQIDMLEKELLVTKKANDDIIKYKNDIIYELNDNIKMLEETTGNRVEYVHEEPLDCHNKLPVSDLSTIGSDSSLNTG